MQKKDFKLYFLCWLLSSCSGYRSFERTPSSFSETEAKNQYLIPDIVTDEGKLSLLMSVNQEIPNLIEDSAKVKIDLFETLETQYEAQEHFFKMTGYRDEMNKYHGTQLEIKVTPKTNEAVTTYVLEDDAFYKFKWHLKEVFSQYKNMATIEKKLKGELLSLKESSSQGLLTGLILSLPENKKNMAFAIKDQKKLVNYLYQNLNEDLSLHFRFEDFGLIKNSGKKAIFQKLSSIEKSEKLIANLMSILLIKKEINLEFNSEILKLSKSDLAVFSNKEALNIRLYALKSMHLQDVEKFINKNIQNKTLEIFREYSTQIKSVQEELKTGLIIKEVSPILALYRGFSAGDCATSRSFSMPNIPTEKVFFIYGENNKLKGYISGHLATIEEGGRNKNVFKVLTINGAHISYTDTHLVLEALDAAKNDLKVDHILLPENERMLKLVNYDLIKKALSEALVENKTVNVRYLDREYRKKLLELKLKFNDPEVDYDLMELNEKSQVFIGQKKNLEIKTRKFSSYLKKGQSTKAQKLSFALKNYKIWGEKSTRDFLKLVDAEQLLDEVFSPHLRAEDLLLKLKSDLELSSFKESEIIRDYFDYFIKAENYKTFFIKKEISIFNDLNSTQLKQVFNAMENVSYDFVSYIYEKIESEQRIVVNSHLVSKMSAEDIYRFSDRYLKEMTVENLRVFLYAGGNKLNNEFFQKHFSYLLNLDNAGIKDFLKNKLEMIDDKKLIIKIIKTESDDFLSSLVTLNLARKEKNVDSEILSLLIEKNNKNLDRKLLSQVFNQHWSRPYSAEFNKVFKSLEQDLKLSDLIKTYHFSKIKNVEALVMSMLNKELAGHLEGQPVRNLIREILFTEGFLMNKKLLMLIYDKYENVAIEQFMDSALFRSEKYYDPLFVRDLFNKMKTSPKRNELSAIISQKVFDKYNVIKIDFIKEYTTHLSEKELKLFLAIYSRHKLKNAIADEYSLAKHILDKHQKIIRADNEMRASFLKILDRYSVLNKNEVALLKKRISKIVIVVPLSGGCLDLMAPFLR